VDKDSRYLGLNARSLRKAERNIGGIGGLIDTYLIEDATMTIKTEDCPLHEEQLVLLVGIHKLDNLTEEKNHYDAAITAGHNVLRKFRLTYDERLMKSSWKAKSQQLLDPMHTSP